MSRLCNNVYVWFSHVAILLVNRKLNGVVGIVRHLRTAGDHPTRKLVTSAPRAFHSRRIQAQSVSVLLQC